MPWHRTDKTYHHAQFGLLDNGRAIVVVCNSWDVSAMPTVKSISVVSRGIKQVMCMKILLIH